MMMRFIPFIGVLGALFFITPGALAEDKIGILFSSYGDVDRVETELQPFLRTALTDPDILPFPAWARMTIAEVGWLFEEKTIREEYKAIGGSSNMRAFSRAQADAVASILRPKGYDVTGYVGFTMTFPFVAEALAKAQADGIQKLVVFYQGAQYSKVTMGITLRHVRAYLAKHPEWNVEVIGIKSFSDDPRFFQLITQRIDAQMDGAFAGYSPDEVCFFFPAHGNIWKLAREGDPYVAQVERLKKKLRNRYPSSPFFIGFQNHDEIPLVKWTQPSTKRALSKVAQHECPAVLVNGLISFTVDNLETLYDHEIGAPQTIAEEVSFLGAPAKDVIVEKMFNDDPDFVEFLSSLVEEALEGKGDLLVLK